MIKYLVNILSGLFLFIITGNDLWSQSPNLPLSRELYHLADRHEITSGKLSSHFHTSTKPYRREQVASFFYEFYKDSSQYKSKTDRFNIEYFLQDNWAYQDTLNGKSERPFLRYFFTQKNDFFSLDIPDFQLHVNPVFYFSGGLEKDHEVIPYINTRGVELSGMISGKIGFYSFLSTTQAAYPSNTRNWINRNLAVPGEGFYKVFNNDGVDYYTATGYVSFNVVKPVNLQLGHGKSYIGNGIRSMILSDFSNNYLFLKINTKIWKINYSNLFAQNYADAYASAGSGSLSGPYPKKFMAHHHLSFDIFKNLNIGLFESVIIGDSTESFDINYLNPVIFYRALEHQNGSKDNVLVGSDFKFNFLKHFSLYGQFILDEFLLEEITSGDGWWGNKYGGQLGLKYINLLGIPNLDGQFEYNFSRPYTFAHKDMYTNYANYKQPLAHPTGANFREFITAFRYQPVPRVTLWLRGLISEYGDDDDQSNWGKDVMKSYVSREKDYGNTIGQGYSTSLHYLSFTTSYHYKFNVFVDLEFLFHDISSENQLWNHSTLYGGINFRWNIPKKEFDY